MVDKTTAQRDVEYFYELLAKDSDENKRVILQRLLAEAERLRQSGDQEESATGKQRPTKLNIKDSLSFVMPAKAGIEETPTLALIRRGENRAAGDYWMIRLRG